MHNPRWWFGPNFMTHIPKNCSTVRCAGKVWRGLVDRRYPQSLGTRLLLASYVDMHSVSLPVLVGVELSLHPQPLADPLAGSREGGDHLCLSINENRFGGLIRYGDWD